MKQFCQKIFLCLIALTIAGMAQAPAELFKQHRDKLGIVQYYKNVSSQSQIGSYIKIKQERIGILVSDDGLVMVNSDVYPLSLDIISGDGGSFASGEPSDFKVKFANGKEYAAEFIGKDDESQVAFVRITDPLPKPLPFVSFAGSKDVDVGDTVFLLELLGENYNNEPIFTPMTINAIVTKPRRKFLVKNGVVAMSAGGLVITDKGEAIAITLRNDYSYSFMSVGEFDEFQQVFMELGPTEWFKELIENPPVLKKSITSSKAWLGIGMQALTEDLREYWKIPAEGGVVVDRIFPDSPAAKSGLKVRDVLVKINGESLEIKRDEETNRFRQMITTQNPGETMEVVYYRDGKKREADIKLQPAPRAIDLAEKLQMSNLGIEVRELTRDIFYNYNLPLDVQGVYVYQVDRASPAGLGGLGTGSIITHVNGKAVKDLVSFEKTIESVLAEKPKKILFQVRLRRNTNFVFAELK